MSQRVNKVDLCAITEKACDRENKTHSHCKDKKEYSKKYGLKTHQQSLLLQCANRIPSLRKIERSIVRVLPEDACPRSHYHR